MSKQITTQPLKEYWLETDDVADEEDLILQMNNGQESTQREQELHLEYPEFQDNKFIIRTQKQGNSLYRAQSTDRGEDSPRKMINNNNAEKMQQQEMRKSVSTPKINLQFVNRRTQSISASNSTAQLRSTIKEKNGSPNIFKINKDDESYENNLLSQNTSPKIQGAHPNKTKHRKFVFKKAPQQDDIESIHKPPVESATFQNMIKSYPDPLKSFKFFSDREQRFGQQDSSSRQGSAEHIIDLNIINTNHIKKPRPRIKSIKSNDEMILPYSSSNQESEDSPYLKKIAQTYTEPRKPNGNVRPVKYIPTHNNIKSISDATSPQNIKKKLVFKQNTDARPVFKNMTPEQQNIIQNKHSPDMKYKGELRQKIQLAGDFKIYNENSSNLNKMPTLNSMS